MAEVVAVVTAVIAVATQVKETLDAIKTGADNGKTIFGRFVSAREKSLRRKQAPILYRVELYVSILSRFSAHIENKPKSKHSDAVLHILKGDHDDLKAALTQLAAVKTAGYVAFWKNVVENTDAKLDALHKKLVANTDQLILHLSLMASDQLATMLKFTEVLSSADARAFWIDSFGPVSSIPRDQFCKLFAKYHCDRLGFASMHHSFIFSVACLIDVPATNATGDGNVSIQEFEDFLGYWGPLQESFEKVLVVLDPEGGVQKWFDLNHKHTHHGSLENPSAGDKGESSPRPLGSSPRAPAVSAVSAVTVPPSGSANPGSSANSNTAESKQAQQPVTIWYKEPTEKYKGLKGIFAVGRPGHNPFVIRNTTKGYCIESKKSEAVFHKTLTECLRSVKLKVSEPHGMDPGKDDYSDVTQTESPDDLMDGEQSTEEEKQAIAAQQNAVRQLQKLRNFLVQLENDVREAMPLKKITTVNVNRLAVDVSHICEKLEMSGPGYFVSRSGSPESEVDV